MTAATPAASAAISGETINELTGAAEILLDPPEEGGR